MIALSIQAGRRSRNNIQSFTSQYPNFYIERGCSNLKMNSQNGVSHQVNYVAGAPYTVVADRKPNCLPITLNQSLTERRNT